MKMFFALLNCSTSLKKLYKINPKASIEINSLCMPAVQKKSEGLKKILYKIILDVLNCVSKTFSKWNEPTKDKNPANKL